MKQTKASDVRTLDVGALQQKLAESKDGLFQKNLDHAMNKLEDSSSLRSTRHEIARIQTIITEKQRGIR